MIFLTGYCSLTVAFLAGTCTGRSSVQFSRSVVSDSATPWTAACQASLSFTISWNFLKFVSTESMMPSNHLILCCPLLLLPSFFPSIRVFSSESALCIRWPKHWSFSVSISPSSEYSGLISFRIDWFDAGPRTISPQGKVFVGRNTSASSTTRNSPRVSKPLVSPQDPCWKALYGGNCSLWPDNVHLSWQNTMVSSPRYSQICL